MTNLSKSIIYQSLRFFLIKSGRGWLRIALTQVLLLVALLSTKYPSLFLKPYFWMTYITCSVIISSLCHWITYLHHLLSNNVTCIPFNASPKINNNFLQISIIINIMSNNCYKADKICKCLEIKQEIDIAFCWPYIFWQQYFSIIIHFYCWNTKNISII